MATTEYNLTTGLLKIENGTATSGAIAVSLTVARVAQITSVTLNLDAAPTTSENFTITLNSVAGAAYDTLLYSLDLSTGSTTDVLWMPDQPFWIQPGDAIDVAYANTDANTYGVLITAVEEL